MTRWTPQVCSENSNLKPQIATCPQGDMLTCPHFRKVMKIQIRQLVWERNENKRCVYNRKLTDCTLYSQITNVAHTSCKSIGPFLEGLLILKRNRFHGDFIIFRSGLSESVMNLFSRIIWNLPSLMLGSMAYIKKCETNF